MASELNTFPDRIRHDNWIARRQEQHFLKYGKSCNPRFSSAPDTSNAAPIRAVPRPHSSRLGRSRYGP